MDIYEPGIAEIFNGISIVRRTADVLEREMSFADLWNEYHAWHEMARQPRVTMVESSPPDQIAYGYDYSPWDKIPPSTLEFARTYYPYVRFGLALTLMNDGYFAHEFGDTWHGNDWWYDELNFELGYPLGPAERVDLGVPPGEDQNVYQRKFTNGLVLLNGSQESQEITIGPGYRRLHGQQAPRYETILDDAEAAFSTTGTWTSVKYDSGELQATGPFYHCWRETCHERSGSQGKARWDLEIQAADTYTITAWWPAAPQADTWNQNVTYEVVVGEQVVASQTFDQRSGGDEWHFVAEVPLSPNNMNYVRMQCQGGAPCLADALHIRSQARYNDGSSATKVTLQPLDGVILTRLKGSDVYLPLLLKK
jgi:hypothetical protein